MYVSFVQVKGDIWYSNVPTGINTLANVVKNLRQAAGFPGFFTNHSLRATAVTRLFDADVDKQLIMTKTGHVSNAARSYKRVSDDKLQQLTDAVTCKTHKSGDDSKASPRHRRRYRTTVTTILVVPCL